MRAGAAGAKTARQRRAPPRSERGRTTRYRSAVLGRCGPSLHQTWTCVRSYAITYARMSLGPRVKALREAMGLSLRDLASRSGVSAPMLSQVERGATSPTLSVAGKIADGLELRLSQLLRLDEEGAVTITRARDGRPSGGDPRAGHRYEVLTPPRPGPRPPPRAPPPPRPPAPRSPPRRAPASAPTSHATSWPPSARPARRTTRR